MSGGAGQEQTSLWASKRFAIVAAVALLVAVPYLPSLGNGFVWLDHKEITGGMLIADSPQELASMFLRDDRNFAGYHRPFYNLIHSFDVWIWGNETAFGFHLCWGSSYSWIQGDGEAIGIPGFRQKLFGSLRVVVPADVRR